MGILETIEKYMRLLKAMGYVAGATLGSAVPGVGTVAGGMAGMATAVGVEQAAARAFESVSGHIRQGVEILRDHAYQQGRTPAERRQFARAAEVTAHGTLATLGLITSGRAIRGLGNVAMGTGPISSTTTTTASTIIRPGPRVNNVSALNVEPLSIAQQLTLSRINNVANIPNIAPKQTSSGYGVTQHGISRKLERSVKSADILDALKNPLQVKDVKFDQRGLPSQRYIGRKATVAINPETGNIVSSNPTSSRLAERLASKK